MNAVRSVLISADSHVSEPPDLWTVRLPEDLSALGPRLEVDEGGARIMVEDRVIRSFPRPRDDADTDRAKTVTQILERGGSDPEQRLADLDLDGVWGEVIYPTLGFLCCFRIERPDVQVAVARVYNDWVAEQLMGSDRFAPVALLPVLDIDAAVDELRRVHARGFRATLMPAHVDARPYNDPAYEPLWAAATEIGMPLTFHAGTGRTTVPVHGPGGAVINYVIQGASVIETVTFLCASGVLARHPDLRVVMVECGSGWLAWALHAMDEAYEEHHAFVEPKLELRPSEYFLRQGYVTFQDDPVGLATLPFTGERCLMWGSDYPHPEGTWPRSREILNERFAELPMDTFERITCANAAELYGFKLPDP